MPTTSEVRVRWG